MALGDTTSPPLYQTDSERERELSRLLYVIVRPSVVCNVRAPYLGDSNFR